MERASSLNRPAGLDRVHTSRNYGLGGIPHRTLGTNQGEAVEVAIPAWQVGPVE